MYSSVAIVTVFGETKHMWSLDEGNLVQESVHEGSTDTFAGCKADRRLLWLKWSTNGHGARKSTSDFRFICYL